jgi:hypothetical protein
MHIPGKLMSITRTLVLFFKKVTNQMFIFRKEGGFGERAGLVAKKGLVVAKLKEVVAKSGVLVAK